VKAARPRDEVGHGTVVGLAFGPFAILFTFWIPTLAVLFVIVAVVAGAIELRGSTGLRRRLALLSLGLGLGSIALLALVLFVPSGPSSGDAVSSIPA
jgi:hypothetical protein